MSEQENNEVEATENEASSTPTPHAEETPAHEEVKEHTVPVSALQKEREKAASKIEQLEAQLAEVAEAEEARKRAELSEVEQAKLEAEEAKAQATALQEKLVQEQRKQVALAAASKAGYRDPSDALRYIDLSSPDIGDDEISEAVTNLLGEREYLKAADPKGPAQTSGVEDGKKAEKAEDGASAVAGVLGDAMKIVGR
jgi:small-conductance mechanosensitive channel